MTHPYDPTKAGKRRRGKHNTTRTCKGKVRYRDDQEAKAALQRLGGREKVPVRSYECPVCHGHHLTSKEQA